MHLSYKFIIIILVSYVEYVRGSKLGDIMKYDNIVVFFQFYFVFISPFLLSRDVFNLVM